MRSKYQVVFWLLTFGLLVNSLSLAQTRDEKVRNDRDNLKNDESWFYDDFESGIKEAKRSDKPLMVVLRCIP